MSSPSLYGSNRAMDSAILVATVKYSRRQQQPQQRHFRSRPKLIQSRDTYNHRRVLPTLQFYNNGLPKVYGVA